MPDTAIDGDISDYIEALDLVSEYFSADLRTYLLNEGHGANDIDSAIARWRQHLFQPLDAEWVRFELTPAGRAAVERLRGRHLSP